MSKEDFITINGLIATIRNSLIGKITRKLRRVGLSWKSLETDVRITFYIDGKLHRDVETLYLDVIKSLQHKFDHITKSISFEVLRVDYPNLLPQDEFLIYQRKEPFKDPTEEDMLEAYQEYLKRKANNLEL